MSRWIAGFVLGLLLLTACARLRRDAVEDRQRDVSPVVALAAFQHCTSELASDDQRAWFRQFNGRFELALDYDEDGTVASRFVVTPGEASPEDARLLERCADFARTYFGYAYSAIGATKWSQPTTVRGTFFPFDTVEEIEADGTVQRMGVSIDRLSRSVTGSSLYRLSYYERDPRAPADPDTGGALEIRLEALKP